MKTEIFCRKSQVHAQDRNYTREVETSIVLLKSNENRDYYWQKIASNTRRFAGGGKFKSRSFMETIVWWSAGGEV